MRGRFRTIRTRLTLITVAFSVIATITLVGISLFQVQRTARTNLLQSIEFNLLLVAEVIQYDLQILDRMNLTAVMQPETIEYLLDVSGSSKPIRALLTRMTEEVRQNLVAYRYLQRLVVMDDALTKRVQVGFFGDESALMPHKLHLLGDFSVIATSRWVGVMLEPFALRERVPILYKASPVYLSAQLIGYVYFAITTDIVLQPLSGYTSLDGSNMYLHVDDTAYSIENHFIEAEIELNDTQLMNISTLNAATQIRSLRNTPDGNLLAVSVPIGMTGLKLTETIPAGLVFEETYLVIRLLLIVCAGVLVIGVLVALYLSRIISLPVRQIGHQLTEIASGNFSPNPDIEGGDEFGEIGRGINQLAKDVDILLKSRIESEQRKSEMEYKMLQSQINPHFLYNTLNSIKWMATIQNATGIAELTVSLSRLLKSIAKINQSIVPLSQELALLEDYFVIARYRYGDSIAYYIDVPSDLHDCEIPIFTLQPIVENAIFHGIEANNGIGTVNVKAELTGGALEITIADDGIGMDDETIRSILQSDRSDKHGLFVEVGIRNVDARIKFEFGTDYGISIDSRIGEYTRVIVKLPWRVKND